MQIDFHHAVTFVLSRLAGFNSLDASKIAYSAQYVDDAVRAETVRFSNGALYQPLVSAHKQLDYRNFIHLANSLVWIPFHFLPGNLYLTGAVDDVENYIHRLICRPNSVLAQEMMAECIMQKKRPNSLQRLGICLHTYADTWAHYGFAGITHRCNTVTYFQDTLDETSKHLVDKLGHFFKEKFDNQAGKFVDTVQPVGHGAVLSYPDLPFLDWQYRDYTGNLIIRNNSEDYIEAAEHMLIALKRFRLGDHNAEVEGLETEERDKILGYFRTLRYENGAVRHRKWLEAIRSGYFTGVKEELAYETQGEGSWVYQAFGLDPAGRESLNYRESFQNSDWKHFHDALRDQHYFLLRTLFPRHELCIA